MTELHIHDIHLVDGPLRLRPLTENDWDILLAWNNDPEVLYYSEGGPITSWALEDMQDMYRDVSQTGQVFMVELEGRPIGECWLQPMNMPEVLRRYPGRDVRRIDLMIGAKELWGRGWGTRVIALLTALAFERCGADAVVGLVGDYNPRSRRAFQKNGYVVDRIVPAGPGDSKARATYELVLTREAYQRRAQSEVR